MSATPTSTFVIVGAGLAGAKAAETLRAEGFDGRLLLLGEEAERPYERPPLSKAYLRGEADRDSLYVHREGFYAAHDIELRPSTPVLAIDTAARQLELVSGERISYERLLLATGAAPRRLRLPGAELAPRGVGVVLEAEHLCMTLRGVQATGARTVTSALHGLLRSDPRSRQEFLALTGIAT